MENGHKIHTFIPTPRYSLFVSLVSSFLNPNAFSSVLITKQMAGHRYQRFCQTSAGTLPFAGIHVTIM